MSESHDGVFSSGVRWSSSKAVSKQELDQVEEQLEKLAGIEGLEVSGVRMGGEQFPKIGVRFVGRPMYLTRGELEREHFDVGQSMGDKELTFYVTKRVTQTEGWSA